jgi:D-alanyl-D-alanine carboxypeptidase (penicillin-binding protein 5/6)
MPRIPLRRIAAACAITLSTLLLVAPSASAQTIGGDTLASPDITVQPLPGAAPLPDVKAETWIVADATTGQVLAAKGAHVQRPPASTLKTLLALTVMPKHSPEETWIAGPKVEHVSGSRVGLATGKTYSLDQLWYAVFLPSANDAAVAVAKINGGVGDTVSQMNETAQRLQAHDTVAKTPNGLDAPGQVSSAYDLALIARAGLQRPDFAKYAGTTRTTFPDRIGNGEHTIVTTNRLLLHGFPGMIGVKTGFTTKAGRTYVGAVRRGDTTIIVAMLGIHESSEQAAKKLFTWALKNNDKVTPIGTLVNPTPGTPGSAVDPNAH